METGNDSNALYYAKEVINNNNEFINIKHFMNKQGNGKYNLIYIYSLRNKLFELEAQIQLYMNNNIVIHFIALTEVRIFDYDKMYFNLPNYNVYFSTRSDGDGGCALFVHNTFNCELIASECSHNINTSTVKIIDLNLNIYVVYKQPPVSFNVFNEIINKHIHTRNGTILVGDININLLNNPNHTRTYIDSLKMDSTYSIKLQTNLQQG